MTNRKQTKARRTAGVTKPTTDDRPRKGPKDSDGSNQRPIGTNQRPPRPGASARLQQRREAERLAARRKRVRVALATVVVIGGLAGGLVALLGNGPSPGLPKSQSDKATQTLTGAPGPEGVPIEAGQLVGTETTAATGQTVDGIQCQSNEQVAYHVHTHLSIFVNGQLRPMPAGIGIVLPNAQQTPQGPFDSATQCFYWLHVHAQDGVIHIESPTTRAYTLGQFFDLWGQPLTTTQVATVTGPITVFVSGRPVTGDPRNINLGSHEDIQIDVGTPVVPPQKINWAVTGL
jgi:hypothetical protein